MSVAFHARPLLHLRVLIQRGGGPSHSIGYDCDQILDKVLAATKVKNGEAVYERDSVLFEKFNMYGRSHLGCCG